MGIRLRNVYLKTMKFLGRRFHTVGVSRSSVLPTSLPRSYYTLSGSLGNCRWMLSSWHLVHVPSAFNESDSSPLLQTSALGGAGSENSILGRICGYRQQLCSQICEKGSSRGRLLVSPGAGARPACCQAGAAAASLARCFPSGGCCRIGYRELRLTGTGMPADTTAHPKSEFSEEK